VVYLRHRLPKVRVFSTIFQTNEEKKASEKLSGYRLDLELRETARDPRVSWKQNAQLRSPLYPPSGPISILRILFALHDGYLTSQPGFSTVDGIELLSKVLRKLGCRTRPILPRRIYSRSVVTILIFLFCYLTRVVSRMFENSPTDRISCGFLHQIGFNFSSTKVKREKIASKRLSANLFIYTITNPYCDYFTLNLQRNRTILDDSIK